MQTASNNSVDAVKLSSSVSVGHYKQLETSKNKPAISQFIFERFFERYISPLKSIPRERKHGFNIIAISCLMIEALESFYLGYEDTNGKSKQCFQSFFRHASYFSSFNTISVKFYHNVRCGILHQAETTGGWKITRKLNAPLFNSRTLTINANSFLSGMESYLNEYKTNLEKSDWNDPIWTNLRNKMAAIIKNCEKETVNAN